MVGIFLIWPSKKGLDGSLCNVCCVYVDQKSNMANTADDHMGNEKKKFSETRNLIESKLHW